MRTSLHENEQNLELKLSTRTSTAHWTNEASKGRWQIHPKETPQEEESADDLGKYPKSNSSIQDSGETKSLYD